MIRKFRSSDSRLTSVFGMRGLNLCRVYRFMQGQGQLRGQADLQPRLGRHRLCGAKTRDSFLCPLNC